MAEDPLFTFLLLPRNRNLEHPLQYVLDLSFNGIVASILMQVDHLDGKTDHFRIGWSMAEGCVEFFLLAWYEVSSTRDGLYQVIIESTQNLADLGQEDVLS